MKRKYYIDLHIHSALSPCAENDMTPNNIVNMAKIKGLDFIAICDHNSVLNAIETCKLQDSDLIVIAGVEVETSEEIHVLCLFKNVLDAKKFGDMLYNSLPKYSLDKKIFGNQLLLNANDNILGEEQYLLSIASAISIDEVFKLVKSLRGVAIPAHIDRTSYSIISNLGGIPEELGVTTIELSKNYDDSNIDSNLKTFNIIKNSDAHRLGDILEKEVYVELEDKTIDSLFQYLTN